MTAAALPAPRPDDEGRETDRARLVAEYQAAALRVAQLFHETYERLAPTFGYETRKASAKPWAEVPENNRCLMTAVCAEILTALTPHPAPLGATAITDDDVRRAVCDFNDWKYAEMMSHVSLRDVRSLALRVVLENFALRAALQAGAAS